MDLLPLSAMTELQRDSQYQADMTQINERRSRTGAHMDPNQQTTMDNWYPTHLPTLERLFPFSNNLTMLIFVIAS